MFWMGLGDYWRDFKVKVSMTLTKNVSFIGLIEKYVIPNSTKHITRQAVRLPCPVIYFITVMVSIP